MKLTFDVVIIGGGPSGLSAAIYLRRYNLTCCIIEKNAPGGKLLIINDIQNYPGFEKIAGYDLATKMYNQALKLGTKFIFNEVLDIDVLSDKKVIKTKDKEIICQGIIIATGRIPKSLGLSEEEKLIGKGISYCATCDGPLFKNKNVAVIGGGLGALEEALYLSNICNKVTIIQHNNKIKDDGFILEKIKKTKNIEIILNTSVKSYKVNNDYLAGLTLLNEKTNEEYDINIDGCFLFIGQTPSNLNFKKLNILDEEGYIMVDENLKTKIDGVYAIGDTLKKSLYQIVNAVSEGAIAATNFAKYFRLKRKK